MPPTGGASARGFDTASKKLAPRAAPLHFATGRCGALECLAGRDLRALGEPRNADCPRELVEQWVARHGRFSLSTNEPIGIAQCRGATAEVYRPMVVRVTRRSGDRQIRQTVDPSARRMKCDVVSGFVSRGSRSPACRRCHLVGAREGGAARFTPAAVSPVEAAGASSPTLATVLSPPPKGASEKTSLKPGCGCGPDASRKNLPSFARHRRAVLHVAARPAGLIRHHTASPSLHRS
jgi:hypothetical protein